MRYLLAAIMIFASFAVRADDKLPESHIMVIRANEVYESAQNENLPTCDDEKLVAEVKAAVKGYLDEQKYGSIVEKRGRRLILKNIDKYTEIPMKTFDNKSNYAVANEIIMAKINRKVRESDMRICVGEGKKPIYLLIYPEDFRYLVQIINFIPPQKNGNAFSIFYVPEVKEYKEFEE